MDKGYQKQGYTDQTNFDQNMDKGGSADNWGHENPTPPNKGQNYTPNNPNSDNGGGWPAKNNPSTHDGKSPWANPVPDSNPPGKGGSAAQPPAEPGYSKQGVTIETGQSAPPAQKGYGGAQPNPSGEYSFSRRYDVQLVPQLTGVSCWAAGAAMLVGYRDAISINPSEIARGIGYWQQYYQHGLNAEDVGMFRHWGLTPAPVQTYTPIGLKDLLVRTRGPLWVASAEPTEHIRVITGIEGDGTADGTILYINDPWDRNMRAFVPTNRGSQYTETFRQFEEKQRELARRESHLQGLYIAHL